MVIDTTLFIEHLRAKDKTQTTLFQLSSTELRYLSAVTVYELFAGATYAIKIADCYPLISTKSFVPNISNAVSK